MKRSAQIRRKKAKKAMKFGGFLWKTKWDKHKSALAIPGALDKRSRRWANGREELRGKDKENRRADIFVRAGDRCEEIVQRPNSVVMIVTRCWNRATEWSHKPCIHIKVGTGHGRGFKCDAMSCGIASCKSCHEKQHGHY